jgi:hypothetical protein
MLRGIVYVLAAFGIGWCLGFLFGSLLKAIVVVICTNGFC